MTNDEEELPEELSFSAPPSKHGKYYIFHIPNSLIKSEQVNPEYIYKITIKPLKKRV